MRAMRIKTPTVEYFEDCVNALLDELQLAIQWNRPSILLAVVPVGKTRLRAQKFLEEKLIEDGQHVRRFSVAAKKFDVARELSSTKPLMDTVFFVSGLAFGGGRNDSNAYRALNMRREILVDNQLKIVFWLTPKEAQALPQRAPDFWAFRHRVIEFRRLRGPNKNK